MSVSEPQHGHALKRPGTISRIRLGTAAGGSLLMHACVAWVLLWHPTDGIRGSGGVQNGPAVGMGAETTWIEAQIVSPGPATPVQAPAELSAKIPHPIDETDSMVPPETLALSTKPPEGEAFNPPAAKPPAETFQHEDANIAATSSFAGGTPGTDEGRFTLLQQIARCLPQGSLPDLQPAVLTLNVDDTGNLSAVPTLNVDAAQLSKNQIRQANEIIQASLQCGPYDVADSHLATFQLVANFTAVAAVRPQATP